MNIPIAKPFVGEEEADAARRVVLSGWLTQGAEVAAFEREFSALVGAGYACAVSSCTTALHLALLAVGVKPGDDVVTVSHSFIATANAIRYCGANPVFVDVERGTFNMDPSLLEQAIGPRCTAILCVHQLGMPCDLPAILAIANRHGVPVIEDAACAAGSQIRWDGAWEPVGRPRGAVACFSFHPRKVMTTGDGGMLTTNDPELDAKFRRWRQHSMSVPDTVRHGSNTVIFESYPELGFNYRMTDLQAAVGRVQIGRLPAMVEHRRVLAKRYADALRGVSGVTVPEEPEWARSNWQSYCVRLRADLGQRDVMQELLDLGVSTRRGVMCAHRERAYTGARAASAMTESEAAQDHCIVLPLYHQMTEQEQGYVVEALAKVTTSGKPAIPA